MLKIFSTYFHVVQFNLQNNDVQQFAGFALLLSKIHLRLRIRNTHTILPKHLVYVVYITLSSNEMVRFVERPVAIECISLCYLSSGILPHLIFSTMITSRFSPTIWFIFQLHTG